MITYSNHTLHISEDDIFMDDVKIKLPMFDQVFLFLVKKISGVFEISQD